jgi:uncharacterized protein (DUF1800 family)
VSIAGRIGGREQAEARPRLRVSRRSVLGAAAVSGAGAAAVRLLGLGKDQVAQIENLLPGAGTATRRGDWSSPLSSESARAAHLLRRATFGATAQEQEQAASEGFNRTVDRLIETPPAAPPELPAAAGAGAVRLNPAALQLWWASWMLQSPTPFAERMTLFWHGHFTSDYRKVGLQTPFILWQNLTWRQMAMTDLRSMLMRVTTDPAMLRYLDLATSTGQNPNENYSRELMELFSLGVGNYKEDDVRAAAKALAGWVEPRPDGYTEVTVDPKNNITRKYGVYQKPATGLFVPGRAYKGGPLTFLGRRANFDTGRVIDQILAQPAVAYFIARKVVQHFVSAKVDESYVRRLGDGFRSSRYDLKSLLRAVFTSPEFVAQQNYRALVKSPVETMVHTLKALDATNLGRLVPQFGANLGQVLFDPPDVGGWPNNEAWISSNSVIGRVNFVAAALQQVKTPPPANDAAGHVDGVFSASTANLLRKAQDEHARWFLTLASPEFQLK